MPDKNKEKEDRDAGAIDRPHPAQPSDFATVILRLDDIKKTNEARFTLQDTVILGGK